jgi:hypothetical protein
LNGEGIDRYPSRSEHEQAILLGLANASFEFFEVLKLFNQFPAAGKYAEMRAENPVNAELWLRHSYEEAQRIARNDSPTRRRIQDAITWARESAWPGSTGMYDRAAYIGVLEIASNAGTLRNVAASGRDVALRSGMRQPTASAALHRLVDYYGKLEIAEQATRVNATRYNVLLDASRSYVHGLSLPKSSKCEEVIKPAHNAFQKAGLGPSAGEIWHALQHGPASVKELVRRTGRVRTTIERNLKRMSFITDPRTGEVFEMVRKNEDGNWEALLVDLDAIAVALGTAGTTERLRAQYERERREHACALAMRKGVN